MHITLEQIKNTPKDQYVQTEYWDGESFKMRCPFCGCSLGRNTSGGVGRDNFVWYDDCSCEGARAAQEHNKNVPAK